MAVAEIAASSGLAPKRESPRAISCSQLWKARRAAARSTSDCAAVSSAVVAIGQPLERSDCWGAAARGGGGAGRADKERLGVGRGRRGRGVLLPYSLAREIERGFADLLLAAGEVEIERA